MDYEYRPSEWVGADSRITQLGALVDDARTIVADLQAEGAPHGENLTKLHTYLNWCVATVNRLKEAK